MSDTNTFWSWSGSYVGYRLTDCLFSDDGHQIGYFAEGDEVYGCYGEYIGEVRSGNRLITNLKKKKWTRGSFEPRVLKSAPGHTNLAPRDMLPGFEDFPSAQASDSERRMTSKETHAH